MPGARHQAVVRLAQVCYSGHCMARAGPAARACHHFSTSPRLWNSALQGAVGVGLWPAELAPCSRRATGRETVKKGHWVSESRSGRAPGFCWPGPSETQGCIPQRLAVPQGHGEEVRARGSGPSKASDALLCGPQRGCHRLLHALTPISCASSHGTQSFPTCEVKFPPFIHFPAVWPIFTPGEAELEMAGGGAAMPSSTFPAPLGKSIRRSPVGSPWAI